MGQMTVEQWYGTIKTGLTKKLTENKEALPAGFNQQRFILNCITVIQDMMKDDKKKAQLEKINPETIPVCLAKAAYLGLDFFNGECYAIPYGGSDAQNYPCLCGAGAQHDLRTCRCHHDFQSQQRAVERWTYSLRLRL